MQGRDEVTGPHPLAVLCSFNPKSFVSPVVTSASVLQECEAVRGEGPADEHVLSTMRMVYRRANCLERSTQAYEAASAGFPKDTELLRGLLGCYVRQEQTPDCTVPSLLLGSAGWHLAVRCGVHWCGKHRLGQHEGSCHEHRGLASATELLGQVQ